MKVERDGAVRLKLSEAQLLELAEHRRMCLTCRESCDPCIRAGRCEGFDKLVDKLIAAKGCGT